MGSSHLQPGHSVIRAWMPWPGFNQLTTQYEEQAGRENAPPDGWTYSRQRWPREERISLLCSLINDGWALLIDHQHQSLLLKRALRISGVVGEVFCHLDQPGVFIPPTMLVLSSQAGLFRERVAGPRDCCVGGPCCHEFASVPSGSALP